MIKYFPDLSLNPDYKVHDFTYSWFSKHLESMEESSLAYTNNNDFPFQLRFLWLRTNHEPVTVRVSKSEKESKIYLKTTSGLGGYEPGSIVKNENRLLSDKEIKTIIEDLDSLQFWQMAYEKCLMMDGAEWILEARNENRYHVVTRSSPESGKFREFCLNLLKLAKYKTKNIY